MGSDTESLARPAAAQFPGEASDGVQAILDRGGGDVTTAFLILLARSETGRDAETIYWHQFDHVPEQYRLPGVRNSQRWVSTPALRAARRAQVAPFDRADHVVQYLFAEPAVPNVLNFVELGAALREAGRMTLNVETVRAAAYEVVAKRAGPEGIPGADVIPWSPSRGVYMIVEEAAQAGASRAAHLETLDELVEVKGVTGAWRYVGAPRGSPKARFDDPRISTTIVFLRDDPLSAADPLGDLTERRWKATGARGLFAAPFHVVVPQYWDRYLP